MTPAFEQFARSKGWSLLHKGETGEYRALNTQAGWLAWQAREVPAGFVVVPETPTQEMCQQGQWKAQEWPKFPLRITPIYRAMLAAAPQQPASVEGGR